MDPNATLIELRELSRRRLYGYAEMSDHDIDRLAELADALDGWLTRGGHPPTDWGR